MYKSCHHSKNLSNSSGAAIRPSAAFPSHPGAQNNTICATQSSSIEKQARIAGHDRPPKTGSFRAVADPAADHAMHHFSHLTDALQFSGRPKARRHAPSSGKSSSNPATPWYKPEYVEKTSQCHRVEAGFATFSTQFRGGRVRLFPPADMANPCIKLFCRVVAVRILRAAALNPAHCFRAGYTDGPIKFVIKMSSQGNVGKRLRMAAMLICGFWPD